MTIYHTPHNFFLPCTCWLTYLSTMNFDIRHNQIKYAHTDWKNCHWQVSGTHSPIWISLDLMALPSCKIPPLETTGLNKYILQHNQTAVEEEIRSLICDNQKLSQQVGMLLKEKLDNARQANRDNQDSSKELEELRKQVSLLAKVLFLTFLLQRDWRLRRTTVVAVCELGGHATSS